MAPIWLYHFTHIENLPGIINRGLLADNFINSADYRNSGNQGIKDYRKCKPVRAGRCVGDYVPFYFAPRSPMLYRQHANGLIQNEKIVYLVAKAASLVEKYEWCFSHINAALNWAQFYFTWQEMLQHVDWSVIHSRIWRSTDTDPDRKERRMAEFLVYQKAGQSHEQK